MRKSALRSMTFRPAGHQGLGEIGRGAVRQREKPQIDVAAGRQRRGIGID